MQFCAAYNTELLHQTLVWGSRRQIHLVSPDDSQLSNSNHLLNANMDTLFLYYVCFNLFLQLKYFCPYGPCNLPWTCSQGGRAKIELITTTTATTLFLLASLTTSWVLGSKSNNYTENMGYNSPSQQSTDLFCSGHGKQWPEFYSIKLPLHIKMP